MKGIFHSDCNHVFEGMENEIGLRYFKLVINDGNWGCKFSGHTPDEAASKAFGKICHQMKMYDKDVPNDYVIKIVEITRNSEKKFFTFVCNRVKTENRISSTIIDPVTGKKRVIYNRYRNDVQPILTKN